jgi:uncharacterized protein (TIGR02266 family)
MRTASRSPVTLKIKFKSTTLEQFIERYSVDISHGGIFIRTKDPLPVGTNLRFEFQLKDASPLITGDGTVVWTRDFDPSRSGVAPGMGVRFDRLPAESQEVLDQILAHKTAKIGKTAEAGFLDQPTKVAFGNVPTVVTPKEILDGLAQAEARRTLVGVGPPRSEDHTPLPRPLPFHQDLDEFPDEAFEEATKVASLEGLARRSAQPHEEAGAVPFGKSLDEDVTVERRRMSSRPPFSTNQPMASAPLAPAMSGEIDRDPAKGEMAAGSPIPAPVPAFQSGPIRAPYGSSSEADAAPARRARDSRQPAESDPFSLPVERGASSRISSRPLRIVDEPPPAAARADHDVDDDADEDGEGPTDAEIAPSVDQTPPVMDPIAMAREPAPGGSSTPWIAAAAVLLLIGGVGGFLLLRDRKGAGDGAKPTAAAPAAPDPARAATPPVAAPAAAASAAAPVGNLEVTIASEPVGAIAELEDGSQSGPTPMTFRGLVAGQSYRVKVTKAGFVAAELTLKADAGDPAKVELAAKPTMLRVTSEPAGAAVFLNGRRQKSVTPVDVPVPARTAEKKRVSLSVRKSGYSNADQQVALDDLVDRGDSMMQEVAVTLVKRPVVVKPPPETADDAEDTSGASEDDASDEAAAGDASKPAEAAGGASKPAGGAGGESKPAEGGGGGQPAGGGASGTAEPAQLDKPAQPDAAKPVERTPPSVTDRDPIPDWMKEK